MSAQTVLISGLGIAGPTLAYWLKQGGFLPTLVEHAPALREGGYVIDFWGLGYDIAERMGLTAEINRIGYHVREVLIPGDRGQRIAGFGTKVISELAQGRFVTVGRSDLSRLLYETVKGDTEAIFGDEIVSLQDGADGVQVGFKHGGKRRFDLVIGADGLHSVVRKIAFGPERQFEKDLGYVVATMQVPGYRPRDEDTYMMYTHPGWMVGRFTMHDDRTLFLFIFAADDRALPSTLEEQKAMLREKYRGGRWECPRILEELDRTPELYFDRVSQIRMNDWSRGRIALIGDAAFCVSLAAGQGSALAMISGYVLAGELAKAQGRHEEAFNKYGMLLQDYVRKKQRGAERFASAFAPRTSWGLWFRNLVIKSFAIPGLARFAIGSDIIVALELPDYSWSRPGESG